MAQPYQNARSAESSEQVFPAGRSTPNLKRHADMQILILN